MPVTKWAVNCSDFRGVTGPVCQTAEAVGVTHVPLTKPATFWIGILKVFLPERNNLAVIYISLAVAWHCGNKVLSAMAVGGGAKSGKMAFANAGRYHTHSQHLLQHLLSARL